MCVYVCVGVWYNTYVITKLFKSVMMCGMSRGLCILCVRMCVVSGDCLVYVLGVC